MAQRWKKGKALFGAQKITPEFLASQGKRKAALLKTLSRAIKEVQLLYANQESRGESRAISDCRPTQQLCSRFEELLRHGLKAGWFGNESSFWPLLLKISRKQAIEYISSLQYAQSEGGKCRAWIRLAVNECSLESYIHILCQDSKLLTQYYESYSFLRDSEMMTALTQHLAGLSQINFNITVDTASLEFGPAPEAVNQVQPALRLRVAGIVSTPSEVVASSADHRKKRKPLSSRQSPASSQYLSVEDNSSQASWSSDEDHTHNSPPLSWTSGDIENGGTEYQNETGGTEFGNQTCEQPGDSVSEVSEKEQTTMLEAEFNLLTEQDPNLPPSTPPPTTPISSSQPPPEDIPSTSPPSPPLSPHAPMSPLPDSLTTDVFQPTSPSPVLIPHTSPSPVLIPPASPSPVLVSSISISPSPVPIPSTSPSPVPISSASPSPTSPHSTVDVPSHFSTANTSTNASLRSSPSPESPQIPSPPKPFSPPAAESPTSSHTTPPPELFPLPETFPPRLLAPPQSNNPFSGEKSDLNPFSREDDISGMENEKVSDSELESTLKRTNTNPFIQLSDLPPNPLNPFDENPFDSPPKLSPSNPFNDDVIAHIDATSSSHQQVGGADEEGEGSGWSEVSSTAGDALPSLEESHCISMSVFQQGKDSPSDLSSQYDKLSDLSSQFDKLSNLSNQFDKVSESDESSRPGSAAKERSDVETISSVPSSVDLSVIEEVEPTDDKLRPQEDYYENEMNVVELERAISKLKAKLITGGSENTAANVETRRRLVRLQTTKIKLKEMEEVGDVVHWMEEPVEKNYQEVNGHQFVRQRRQKTETVCEGCNKKISKITLRPWSKCKKCRCCCHKSCFTSLSLICTATLHNSQASNRYILDICPELGLTQQSFRCFSCNQAFNASSSNTTPAAARLCDYSGRYYCPGCHHNNQAIIPARVVHNWDFAPRKVCCRCYDLLERLYNKPLVRIDHVNSLLYTYVPNLSTIETLRKEVLHMVKYLEQCESAKESGLLVKLDPFPHFKDTSRQFSLSDMERIRDNQLLPRLKEIHQTFISHIRQTCSYCYSRGSSCSVCGSGESLFPFDRQVKLCPQCKTLFHKTCYIELTSCPKCYRHRRTKT